jgi:hypothetical protein
MKYGHQSEKCVNFQNKRKYKIDHMILILILVSAPCSKHLSKDCHLVISFLLATRSMTKRATFPVIHTKFQTTDNLVFKNDDP